MKCRNPHSHNISDFFRGFFIASLFILLFLSVLLGVSTAQKATERICFGPDGATDWSNVSSSPPDKRNSFT